MEQIKIVEKYYLDGETLQERYEIKGSEKHGTYEKFYESGEIMCRTKYVKDKKHGTCEEFYESGGAMSRVEYVEGKEHGTSEWFYESGEIGGIVC